MFVGMTLRNGAGLKTQSPMLTGAGQMQQSQMNRKPKPDHLPAQLMLQSQYSKLQS